MILNVLRQEGIMNLRLLRSRSKVRKLCRKHLLLSRVTLTHVLSLTKAIYTIFAPVSREDEIDFPQADTIGKEAKNAVIRNQFQNGSSINGSSLKKIKRLKPKNLAFMLLIKSQLLDKAS